MTEVTTEYEVEATFWYRSDVDPVEANRLLVTALADRWMAAIPWEDRRLSFDAKKRTVTFTVGHVQAATPRGAVRNVLAVTRGVLDTVELPAGIVLSGRERVEVIPTAEHEDMLDDRYGPDEKDARD